MLILIIIIIFILTINNRQIRDRCTLHSILFAKRYKFSENNFYVNLSYNVIIIFISHFIYAPNLEHISNCLKMKVFYIAYVFPSLLYLNS